MHLGTAVRVLLPKSDTATLRSDSRGVRVLLVGTGRRAVHAARGVRESSHKVLLGTLDSAPQPELAAEFPDIPWLGSFEHLLDVIVDHSIDEIEVALPMRSCFDQVQSLQATSRELGIPITVRLNLTIDGGNSDVDDNSDALAMTFNRHPSLSAFPKFAKRVLDVIIASVAVVLLSPLVAIIVLAIKLTTPGPVFFTQPRMGLGRRVFQMIKFRTMVKDAEQVRKEIEHLNDARGISFKALVKAAEAGATHGEMVKTLRTELGFGQPFDETARVL